jgi:glyoxylase-like metal-dependent hydrolase (beta-lactamase superfamily II)
MRRLLRYLIRLVLGLLLFATAGLAWAHYAIRQERAPLPGLEAITSAAAAGGDLPIRLSIINTASQPMPRSGVLDPGGDPRPKEPYVMSHSAFVLEWADGRLLLIDVGMTPEQAVEFGKPVEWVAGGQATQAHGSSAEQLGAAAKHVAGVIFTHTHSDHIGGIGALCAAAGHPIPAFMTQAQAERANYTTRPGLQALADSGCAQPSALGGEALKSVPGFPGVQVIDAGGHTPGSQIVLAFVQGADGVRRYAFTGDIVNNLDGVLADVPKPLLYRTLVVPEDGERQAELRHFLKRLRDEAQFTLLVSHDQRALEASGVAAYKGERR